MSVAEIHQDLEPRTPPQDVDAERSTLGGMLLSKAAIGDCLETGLRGPDFYRPAHETIFNAIVALDARGEPVDAITVADELGKAGELKRIGGQAFLHELIQSVPTAANAGYYAEILREQAILRRLVETGTRIVQLGYSEGGDALDIWNAARAELDEVVVADDSTTHTDDLYAALDALDDDSADLLPTPWPELTHAIGGWRPGCLYYIGARPAVGKSVVAVQCALDAARRGRHGHVASLEMSKVEIYHRMLSSVGTIDQDKIQRRALGKDEWARASKAAASIEPLPLSVDDRATQRVADVRARARALARGGKLGLIVVDYLQLMHSGHKVESRQQEVSAFSRELKVLAKELHVPVIALSQLNRQSEHRFDRMPGLSDMRESGALEQDGDVVILLHRDPDRPHEIDFNVAKNRHGDTRVVTLGWEGQYSRVIASKWSPPPTKSFPEAPASYLKD